jgi:hypothetical protein
MQFIDFQKLINELKPDPKIQNFPIKGIDFVPRYLLNKFKEYLSPDSDPYFSLLNPVFSLELAYEPGRMKAMKVLSLRDGVMPLLKYFAFNPEPNSESNILIIDDYLSSLVPPIWREKVILRRYQHDLEEGNASQKRNKILFLISPISENFSTDTFEKEINSLSELVCDQDELLVYFSLARLRGDGQAQKSESLGYKLLLKIRDRFPTNKLNILSWSEYSVMDMGKINFHIINPLKYYFTDSFLQHDISQRGGKPLISNEANTTEAYFYKISFNHGFLLHQSFVEYNNFNYGNLKNYVPEFQMTADEKKNNLKSNSFCTPEFNDWAQDVALDLYLSRQ